MRLNKNIFFPFTRAFKNPFFSATFLFFLLFITAVLFGDRGWYEPDGVAILAGSVNLDLAKQGDFYLYGYFAQPLTYELNHLLYRLFNRGTILYILPAFFGALGACFLILAVYFFSEKTVGIFSGFFIILLLPEIILRLLYPNASVFAMTFFCAGLLLLFIPSGRNGPGSAYVRLFCIGFFGALACLFRLDFIFGLPLLFFLVWSKNNSLRGFGLCLSGVAALAALCAALGILNPFEIMRFNEFHAAFFRSLEWSNGQVLAVLMAGVNILVWIVLAGYAAACFWHILRTRRFFWLLGVIAVLVLFYPVVAGFNSLHYILPAFCFAPFALVRAAKGLSKRAGIKTLVILSVFLQFFSIEADTALPFIYVGPHPSYVYTHDGRRFFGAYWRGYADVFFSQHSPYWDGALALSHGIVEVITKNKKDFTIVAAAQEQGNYLSALNIYTLPFFLQLQGYTLEYQKEKLVLRKNNTVLIEDLPYEQYRHFEQAGRSGSQVIKIPLVSRWSPDFRRQLYLFYREVCGTCRTPISQK